MAEASSPSDGFRAANERVRQAIEALPDYASPAFWPTVRKQANSLPLEALAHVLGECYRVGTATQVDETIDMLMNRVYPIANGFVQRLIPGLPQYWEDAIDAAFIRICRRIEEGHRFCERNFNWVLKTACIDECRRFLPPKERKPTADNATPARQDIRPLPVRHMANAGVEAGVLSRMRYQEALARLEPELQQVMRLYCEDDFSQRQIAKRLGCTEKTVHARLDKVRQKLTAFLTEEYHDED